MSTCIPMTETVCLGNVKARGWWSVGKSARARYITMLLPEPSLNGMSFKLLFYATARSLGIHVLNSKDVLKMYAEMGTLDGVAKLFSDSGVLLPAWVHYLAFDLMAGHYLVQKNIA